MEKITVEELEAKFDYYVRRVEKGESFEIVDKTGEAIAEINPAPKADD